MWIISKRIFRAHLPEVVPNLNRVQGIVHNRPFVLLFLLNFDLAVGQFHFCHHFGLRSANAAQCRL